MSDSDRSGDDAPTADREFGGYFLLEQIGSGGMGVVYRALDAERREVAVKILHPATGADPHVRARLAREVATLHRARGAGVARVLDAEVDSEEAFVVTEFIDGPTLQDDVEDWGTYDASELAGLASGLKQALEQIHSVGVVHRDLKPSNVMMGAQGPVLIDFGIAQVADDVRFTQTGLVTGTAGYLDPQALSGGQPTPAGDWWSWAAVLCFAATGRPPFGRGPVPGVVARVYEHQVDVVGLRSDVAEILIAALDPEPERRPSPDEVMATIYAAAESDPTAPIMVEGSAREALVTEHLEHARLDVAEASVDSTQQLGSGAGDRFESEPTDVMPKAEESAATAVYPAGRGDAGLVVYPQPVPPSQSVAYEQGTPYRVPSPYLQDPFAYGYRPYQAPFARPLPWISLSFLIALSALGTRWPGLVVMAMIAWMYVSGVAGMGIEAHQRSVWRFGKRGADGLRVLGRAVWHAIGQLFALAWHVIVALFVLFGVGLAGGADWNAGMSSDVTQPAVAAGASAIAIIALWWQPSFAPGRMATRRMGSIAFPGFWSRIVLAAALVSLGVIVMLSTFGSSVRVNWLPLNLIVDAIAQAGSVFAAFGG